MPTTLPPVLVDRALVARALTNIIENALHAMPRAGTLTVDSRLPRTAASRVEIVSDTGVGMDAEALARVFEPYFSTKATGPGLGLTIAKRNVELNGGTIAVTSERERARPSSCAAGDQRSDRRTSARARSVGSKPCSASRVVRASARRLARELGVSQRASAPRSRVHASADERRREVAVGHHQQHFVAAGPPAAARPAREQAAAPG